MGWHSLIGLRDENTRSCWGYTFQLTDNHYTLKQTAPMKQSFDRLGGKALERLDIISPPLRSALPRRSGKFAEKEAGDGRIVDQAMSIPPRDLYVLLRDNASNDQVLGKLWAEVNTVPTWVDWGQIARGQEVFYR